MGSTATPRAPAAGRTGTRSRAAGRWVGAALVAAHTAGTCTHVAWEGEQARLAVAGQRLVALEAQVPLLPPVRAPAVLDQPATARARAGGPGARLGKDGRPRLLVWSGLVSQLSAGPSSTAVAADRRAACQRRRAPAPLTTPRRWRRRCHTPRRGQSGPAAWRTAGSAGRRWGQGRRGAGPGKGSAARRGPSGPPPLSNQPPALLERPPARCLP